MYTTGTTVLTSYFPTYRTTDLTAPPDSDSYPVRKRRRTERAQESMEILEILEYDEHDDEEDFQD